ncbi:MAG: hypothetical protein H0V51_16960 [Chloroflexi bacterium]|nr:hypothetical protein [Chloroflexota bacterium]
MTEITKAGTPSVSSALTLPANRINGLLAGEDIAAGDACHIGGNGKAYRSIGAIVDEAADVRGFAAGEASSGEAVTLAFDVTMRYGAALTPSDTLYLSGTVRGGLANSPSLGGTEPVAFVVDATRIHVLQN